MGAFSYKDLTIIYEDNHLLVVEKPINMPMQADQSKDLDLLSVCKDYLKETYQKPGNVYCGMVHRLDRPVGGVCVFTKTSKAASRLSQQIRENEVHKEYLAVLCGKSKLEDQLTDYLIKNEKTNMVSVTNKNTTKAKKAILHYQQIQYKDKFSLVKIQLETGRSHQIRVQFSSRNLPLWGDQRYNNKAVVGQQIALWASSLSFIHPTKKEKISVSSLPPKRDIWNLFEVIYD